MVSLDSPDNYIWFARVVALVHALIVATTVAGGACEIEDIVHERTLRVDKRNSRSTIVWNPWIEGSPRLAEFADEDWAHMLCVESGNVGPDAVQLAPGATHTLSLRVSVA